MMKARSTAEWMRFFEEADIPHAPLHDLDSLIDDPHLTAVGLIQSLEHPTEGTLRTLGIPQDWSESQPELRYPAPRLGEHTVQLLREYGFADHEIDAFLRSHAARVAAGPVDFATQ